MPAEDYDQGYPDESHRDDQIPRHVKEAAPSDFYAQPSSQ